MGLYCATLKYAILGIEVRETLTRKVVFCKSFSIAWNNYLCWDFNEDGTFLHILRVDLHTNRGHRDECKLWSLYIYSESHKIGKFIFEPQS